MAVYWAHGLIVINSMDTENEILFILWVLVASGKPFQDKHTNHSATISSHNIWDYTISREVYSIMLNEGQELKSEPGFYFIVLPNRTHGWNVQIYLQYNGVEVRIIFSKRIHLLGFEIMASENEISLEKSNLFIKLSISQNPDASSLVLLETVHPQNPCARIGWHSNKWAEEEEKKEEKEEKKEEEQVEEDEKEEEEKKEQMEEEEEDEKEEKQVEDEEEEKEKKQVEEDEENEEEEEQVEEDEDEDEDEEEEEKEEEMNEYEEENEMKK
ncbi:hypothetical protein CAPTEDRAFT_216294 [Capitella teleta]|uniref:Uncharacterized protein n=1 Tax=Capitella teleta TaxID=283909 RepID=R7UCS0_CAPTE|nr:hypothetical protein CAPTEDRAFT_216294 [Capitella teleta]|eukprot:ELU03896.1 hypothetical protein CAPTEDRAFT_216294 [Capitella teleta]